MPLKGKSFRLFLPYCLACIAFLILFFSYKPGSELELPHIKTININTKGVKIEHIKNLHYEGLPNPFIGRERIVEKLTRGSVDVSCEHTLSLIILGNKKTCIIDGKTMRVGDRVDGLKVLKIERNSVTILENGKKKRLKI